MYSHYDHRYACTIYGLSFYLYADPRYMCTDFIDDKKILAEESLYA